MHSKDIIESAREMFPATLVIALGYEPRSATAAVIRGVRAEAWAFAWDGVDLVADDVTAERPWRVRLQHARCGGVVPCMQKAGV